MNRAKYFNIKLNVCLDEKRVNFPDLVLIVDSAECC